MALTVEELQIKLGCDASQAQDILKQMDATVKAYTDKFQKYFQNMGGKADGKVPALDAVVKGVERQAKKLSKAGADWKKAYEETWGETFESSMMKAKIRSAAYGARPYTPSGEKYVGLGGGMGTAYNKEFAKAKPGGKPDSALLDLGYDAIGKLEDGLTRVTTISSAFRQKMMDARDAVQEAGKKWVAAVNQSGNDSQTATKAESAFKKAIYAADGYAQKLDKIAAKEESQAGAAGIDNVAASLERASGRAGSFGAALKKAFNASLLGKFLAQFKRILLRMLAMKIIRGTIDAIKKGLEELAKTSESSAKAMNTISAAGGTIKMALGAAAMPILKALAPIFYAIASAAITAANAVANFLAVLTGQGFYTPVKMSKGLDQLSKSAGGAGKSAKNMLASFDKINLITSQGGGGGGGGVDLSFASTGKDEKAGNDVASMIRDAMKAGDWGSVGAIIAEQINGSIRKSINGSFGRKVAIWISKAFKNALNFLTGLIGNIDWANIGRIIVNNLVSFFANVDYIGLALAILRFIKAALSIVPNLLIGALWGLVENIASLIKTAIENAPALVEAGIDLITKFLSGALEEMEKIGTWVFDNIFMPIATEIGLITNDMIDLGFSIGSAIIKGISNAIQKVSTVLSSLYDIITGYLGIGLEYVKAFFATLVDFVSTRGSLIKLNVEKWMAQMKAFIYNGLATFVESLTGGPLEKILKIIGVDLAGAASSLRQKANEATTKVGELDSSIASAQKKAKEGFDIDAHVDHTKVDEYKKQISNGISALVTLTADASALKSAIKSAMSMKFSMVFKVPGQSSKTGSIETKYIGLALAKGGLAYGLTPAVIGEYAGASSNPEVVAPLSDLTGILARANIGGNKDSMTKEQANTMISLLQDIKRKENVIQPSVGLGQVVQRSLDAYART